jgi:hypothetical protein
MSRRRTTQFAAAAFALAALGAAAPPAGAADMDPYYAPKAGSPYDDPRYGDIYGHPPPRYAEPRYAPPYHPPSRWEPPRYAEPYDEPAPHVRRDRYGYLEPMPGPWSWRDRDRRYSRHGSDCAPRREVLRNLTEQGWSDFQEPELRGEAAIVRARRPSGHIFELRIDRCSGEVIEARPLGGDQRHYSWRDRPGYRAY